MLSAPKVLNTPAYIPKKSTLLRISAFARLFDEEFFPPGKLWDKNEDWLCDRSDRCDEGTQVMRLSQIAKPKKKLLTAITALAVLLATPNQSVLAHGGEDHGDQKPATVSQGTNMIVHVARAGDYEIVIKHAPVEPDKEMVARVFVTRFASNEPVTSIKPIVMLTSENGAPIEVTGVASTTPGMYEVKLPPLPKGQYKLAARIDDHGETKTAAFGALAVAPQTVTAIGTIAAWARTTLIVLGTLVGLGVIGFIGIVIYRAVQASRRERISGETASA